MLGSSFINNNICTEVKIGSTDDSLLYRIRVDKSVKKQNTKTRENQNKNRLPPIKWHRGVCVCGGEECTHVFMFGREK